ncbi:hypothetical protein AVEN_259149-1 [Araneus ventricosus]|uniref:Uncharacterized protein n=1 Tax=Araneus ventricosus TaxID=182803 RepID=A0A4Y2JPH9_ARAVE|nr:hypothetical protein AVEN_259149-1 [Araneus ventricosus]
MRETVHWCRTEGWICNPSGYPSLHLNFRVMNQHKWEWIRAGAWFKEEAGFGFARQACGKLAASSFHGDFEAFVNLLQACTLVMTNLWQACCKFVPW